MAAKDAGIRTQQNREIDLIARLRNCERELAQMNPRVAAVYGGRSQETELSYRIDRLAFYC